MHLQLHRACTNYIDELYFVVVLTNVKAQHTCTSTTVLVAVPPPPPTHRHIPIQFDFEDRKPMGLNLNVVIARESSNP